MSKETRRKKRTQTGVIIGLLVLLVISYFVSQSGKKVDPAVIASVEVSEPTEHLKGSLESELKLIEYSNFKCGHCANTVPKIYSLLELYGDQFQFEFKHFPFMTHADLAAWATEAAGMQGKFWEMHDKLFENQNEWGNSPNPKRHLRNYAEEIGINVDRFEFDLESDTVKQVIEKHLDEVKNLGLTGTPSFVLNGEQIDINTFVNENLVLDPEQTETTE